MHYRPGQSMTFDSDGLQADVMRFMAIIAFCLIAILALVQNIEPPKPESAVELLPQPVAEVLEAEVMADPVETLVRPVETPLLRLSDEVKVVQNTFEPLPVEEILIPLETAPDFSEKPPLHSPEKPPLHSPEKPPLHSPEKPPLALRFVSDDAFVALISTAKIQLYARAGNDYYLMAANFDITQGPPAGALYDLLPSSIPGKISRLFNRTMVADNYLVALPGDMQAELNGFLHNMAGEGIQGGTLVIHRNGHLSYEN